MNKTTGLVWRSTAARAGICTVLIIGTAALASGQAPASNQQSPPAPPTFEESIEIVGATPIHGLGIDRETRDYLMTRLGADQALSRSEVVKLALYAHGGAATVPFAHIGALVDSLEDRQFLARRRDDHLAAAAMGNATGSAVLVEQGLASDAERGLERAGRMIEAGMDDLPEISDKEEDFIDRAVDPRLNSRLACQCIVQGNEDMVVTIPEQDFLGH